ncbi:MAG: SPOR domain-containing protein [Mangrovibacterium sp.]
MRKILFCLFTLIISFASCKKETKPSVIPASKLTPAKVATDSIATDTSSFNYDYEVQEVDNKSNQTGNPTLNENDKYFVIVASFETKHRANKHLEYLKAKGKNGIIIQRNRGLNMENYRIAIQSSNSRHEALNIADSIKSEFPGVWVLIK